MATNQAPTKFVQKIKDKMSSQNIGVTELSRKLKVSHPTVVDLVTYSKKPSFDTCIALAAWFNQSPVSILREAGLLPPEGNDEVRYEDWKFLIDQLNTEDEAELRQIAEMKILRRKKEETLKSLKPKKAER